MIPEVPNDKTTICKTDHKLQANTSTQQCTHTIWMVGAPKEVVSRLDNAIRSSVNTMFWDRWDMGDDGTAPRVKVG